MNVEMFPFKVRYIDNAIYGSLVFCYRSSMMVLGYITSCTYQYIYIYPMSACMPLQNRKVYKSKTDRTIHSLYHNIMIKQYIILVPHEPGMIPICMHLYI